MYTYPAELSIEGSDSRINNNRGGPFFWSCYIREEKERIARKDPNGGGGPLKRILISDSPNAHNGARLKRTSKTDD